MVATDGHRLAFDERTLSSLGLAKGSHSAAQGTGRIEKVLESGDDGVVSIGFRENMGLVIKDKVELFMRLIDGDFPDYTKVIPKGNQKLRMLNTRNCSRHYAAFQYFERAVQGYQDGI